MDQFVKTGQPGSPRNILLVLFALSTTVIFLFSCASFDSQQEGVVGTVYDVTGIKILMDSGADRLLAFAIRNDSNTEKTVRLRALGGEIGWNTGGGKGFASVGSSNVYRAGYFVSPGEIVLNPGEEIMGQIFLNNWYHANKDFSSRFEFRVIDDSERHMVKIEADQDDIFENAKDMFQQNKLGRNDPGTYGSKHFSVDSLPVNYSLTIPE